MESKVKLLDDNYDLSKENELELVSTMEDLCQQYDKCYHGMSTATGDVWNCIVKVASEIVKRK